MAKKPTSKYADVITRLAPAPPREPGDEDPDALAPSAIALERARLIAAQPSLDDLATAYTAARAERDRLAAEVSAVHVRLAALEALLAESQDGGEVGWGRYGAPPHGYRFPDGRTIYVTREPDCRVEDREAFRQWCVAHGYERDLRLWPSTMAKITKERLLAQQGEPDGVKAYYRSVVKLR